MKKCKEGRVQEMIEAEKGKVEKEKMTGERREGFCSGSPRSVVYGYHFSVSGYFSGFTPKLNRTSEKQA
jgi:hypothetical protein